MFNGFTYLRPNEMPITFGYIYAEKYTERENLLVILKFY